MVLHFLSFANQRDQKTLFHHFIWNLFDYAWGQMSLHLFDSFHHFSKENQNMWVLDPAWLPGEVWPQPQLPHPWDGGSQPAGCSGLLSSKKFCGFLPFSYLVLLGAEGTCFLDLPATSHTVLKWPKVSPMTTGDEKTKRESQELVLWFISGPWVRTGVME